MAHHEAIAVDFDGITIDAFKSSTGEYLIPHREIARMFSAPEWEVLSLAGGNSPLLNMPQFQRVAIKLAHRGNTIAADFVEAMACEGIENRFRGVK